MELTVFVISNSSSSRSSSMYVQGSSIDPYTVVKVEATKSKQASKQIGKPIQLDNLAEPSSNKQAS